MKTLIVALRGITNNASILQYPRNNVEDGAENAFTEWIVLRTMSRTVGHSLENYFLNK
jgi:hypothetical protein